MNIISATDPKWIDEAKTGIFLTVLFDEFPDPIQFVASLMDIEPHGIELYNRAIAGEFGLVSLADPVVPAPGPPVPTFSEVFHAKMKSLKDLRTKEIAVSLGTHVNNLNNVESKISRVTTMAQEIRYNPSAFYGTTFNGTVLGSKDVDVLSVVGTYLAARVAESNAIDVITKKYNVLLVALSECTTIDEVNLIK